MKLFDLSNKVAIVTGGYGHLGSAMCRALAYQGATVIAAGRSLEKYNKAFTTDEKQNIHFCEIDITSDPSVKKCFQTVQQSFGSIDILINNAISLKPGKPEQTERTDWNYSMDGLTASVHSCIREVLPYMENKDGRIINIASMYGMVSPDFSIYDSFPEAFNPAQYGAAKAAVIQLTKYYAAYLSKKKINVNCISPGPFPGELTQKHIGFIEEITRRVPLGRFGKPEDLMGTVVLLASSESSFMTGQNIVVDGGWTIQ